MEKWFIKPKKNSLDIPPNQFLSSNTTEFSSTAEVISTQQTYHDDVLNSLSLKFFRNLIQRQRIHRDR
jgi:hypothetical protein